MAKRQSSKQSKNSKKAAKKVPSVPNPHDHFFRHTFLQQDHAKEFLETYLPTELLAHLDLGALQHESTTYVDERLAEHLSDVLYEAPLRAADPETLPASIYFLLEHKSVPEQEVPLQLLRYMYERWVADMIDGKPMRLIIPIVFYHGGRNWNVPTQFIDRFKDVDEIFHAFVPDFRYILFDTSEHDAEQIRQVISSGSLQAALLLLKYIYDQSLDQKLAEILDPLAKSNLSHSRMLAQLKAILTYITHTNNPVNALELTEVVQEKFVKEEGTMSVLVDEWREQGIKQERERSKQKQRETIRRILVHKFFQDENAAVSSDQEEESNLKSSSDMMKEAVTRLEYVNTESELDALIDIVLTVPSLEVFLRYLPTELETETAEIAEDDLVISYDAKTFEGEHSPV